jgi:orotidine-5'-phosphate decarboxylase
MAAMKTTPIIALDFSTPGAALSLVDKLGERCSFYKVGSELFTAAGPAVVREIRERDRDVFLDLKLHDIPNTVGGAVKSAGQLGVKLLTIHASGGPAMIEAAVKAAGDQDRLGILCVTVLTSLSGPDVARAWGRSDPVDPTVEVMRLASLAAGAGAHGIVCSGLEAAAVRAEFGGRLSTLVPGVRPAGADTQDQARVVTPTGAVKAGARYIVLGRAVTGAPDPAVALDRINAELAGAGV